MDHLSRFHIYHQVLAVSIPQPHYVSKHTPDRAGFDKVVSRNQPRGRVREF